MEQMETKEFTLLTPFSIVTKDVSVTDHTNDRILKISGCANFSGLDEFGKTYVDLSGDRINPQGVDTSAWEVNPQILYQHQRDYTIGKGLSIEKRPEGIWITAEIHADAMTPQDFYRIKSGLVCMFSVGFRTVTSEWITDSGREIYYIKECLLLEVSAVSIPCNLKSQFEVCKSLEDGTVTTEGKLAVQKDKPTHSETEKETAMTNIKVKRADLLNEKDLEQFKSLGGNETEEVEVALSSFIKSMVAQAVADAFAEKEAAEKSAKEELEKKEAEEKSAQEAEAARVAEEAKVEEEKQLADELSEYKALIETLKAAIAEEK